jgi:CRP-like cAMP-binding protein
VVEDGYGTGFFGDLRPADRELLRTEARRRTYPIGTVLFIEGDHAQHVLIILHGLIKLTKGVPDGREVVIELRGPGEILGELSAIDSEPRSATGVAIEPAEVLIIGNERFRALLATHASLATAVLTTVVSRLREASARQLEMGTADALGRVARRLVELTELRGHQRDGELRLVSPISQQELAEWAGVSRDAVVRALTTLRRLGWVDTGRRQFVIRDLDALRQRAEG